MLFELKSPIMCITFLWYVRTQNSRPVHNLGQWASLFDIQARVFVFGEFFCYFGGFNFPKNNSWPPSRDIDPYLVPDRLPVLIGRDYALVYMQLLSRPWGLYSVHNLCKVMNIPNDVWCNYICKLFFRYSNHVHHMCGIFGLINTTDTTLCTVFVYSRVAACLAY